MQKVLVPYDGSESANRALQFVLDQPSATRPAEIHLLNVQDRPGDYGDYLPAAAVDGLHEVQILQGRKTLKAAAERVTSAKLARKLHVLLGNVEQAIVDQAEEWGCDQIVMGTSGLGSLKGLVVGSVAAKVIHLTRLPVTLVK
ncbi:MAG: universal stress protein [Panacagrimonas sp.]